MCSRGDGAGREVKHSRSAATELGLESGVEFGGKMRQTDEVLQLSYLLRWPFSGKGKRRMTDTFL